MSSPCVESLDKPRDACLSPYHQETDGVAETLAKRVILFEDVRMDDLSTDELVTRLQASGLSASPDGLRLDVHRGLISPLMPSTETPGRGVAARWSPMSVRRARRMARLRKRGVNGHVLPLLLFLADGWGWEHILPTLQRAVDKAWRLDRAYLNQPTRVRTPDDLLDNAHDVEMWIGRPNHRTVVDLRSWLYSQGWYGETHGNGSPVPYMTTMLPKSLGLDLPAESQDAARVQGRAYVDRREALHLPASGVAAWLETLTPEAVAQGRIMFWYMVRMMRQQHHKAAMAGSSNPLTLGGESAAEIGAYLRGSTGRLTAAQMLGAFIAQAMLMGVISGGVRTMSRQQE
jgi:hypothetical protein